MSHETKPDPHRDVGRPTMSREQGRVESEIERAMARGDFDDLPGLGKPIPNLDKRDPDWWVKGWIEREDLELAPPVPLQLRAEGEGMRATLRGEWSEERVRELVADFNARVLAERLRPQVGRHIFVPTIDVEDAVRTWHADRPRPVASAERAAAERSAKPRRRTWRTWWRRGR